MHVQYSMNQAITHFESSAAFAADAYAGIRKKPACIICSRAPGATNAAIGIHTAMQASRPAVLIITNIPRPLKGRGAFQEVNYQLMYAPVAKAIFDVHSVDEVAGVMARALDLSVSGRPGPVVVAISKDILDEEREPDVPKPAATVRVGPDADAVAEAARLIEQSKHPIVIAGEIASFENAGAALESFADATGAGVLTAYRQQDAIRADHPAHFGHLSINRLPFQEKALAEADLIIAMGSRLDSVTTADYAMLRPEQKLIMVYPDPSEFAQWQPDVALGSHTVPAMAAIADALQSPPPPERIAWRDAVHQQEVDFAVPGEIQVQGDVDMAKVINHFNAAVPKNAVMVSDAGTFGRWITRYYRFNEPNTELSPVSGAMGYGVPGGIGAQVANAAAPVFVWVGDGGFLMTGNECAAIVQEELPVKIIVCDNSCWGSILVHQQKRFDGWDFGTRLHSPDFAALGRGYGMPAWTVAKTEEFPAALEEMMAVKGPAMLHLLLDLRDVSPYSGSAR
ncbi:MAG: thiamine pyrophosphate-dependent enzyme [Alphaproteobacteria bacterium]|nr:thiamine pyrophosphate-dependent enzyme [Alphaproteobacteria bacterium]